MKSKRIIASMLLVALALCCFAGCAEGASKAGENGLSSDGATGTRSNPYKFGDEITLDFYSMPSVYSDWINGVATIKFMEFIDSAALKNEYPNHSLDEYDACIMAYVQISELSSDQALSINDVISTHYITNNLRSVEFNYSWQSQAIHGDTVSLYSAGSAQAYTWVPLDKLQSGESFSYIVMEYYTDIKSTVKEIWVAFPGTVSGTVADDDSAESTTPNSTSVVTPTPTPNPVETFVKAAYDEAIDLLKSKLKNPSSLTVNSRNGTFFIDNDNIYYCFIIDYSAMNGFGGYDRDTFYCAIECVPYTADSALYNEIDLGDYNDMIDTAKVIGYVSSSFTCYTLE